VTRWRTRAFGLAVEAGFPLPGAAHTAEGGPPQVRLELATPAAVDAAWSGAGGPPVWQTAIDKRPVSLLHGEAGDHLLTFGGAAFHFDAATDVVLCAGDRDEARWQRFVLDTVLWSASLLHGFELLHASAVSTPAGPVALVAPSGFGKTSLAIALMERGYPLFADDILAFAHGEDGVVCHPGPALMNVPLRRMVRGLGRRIAALDDEAWLELAGTAEERPAPAAAVFVLEPGRPGTARRVQPSPLRLLPHTLSFRHLPDRQRRRFEVFAELAASTPIFALLGAMQAAPSRLADEVERALERVASGDVLAGVAV
jgi:hypothetical protein